MAEKTLISIYKNFADTKDVDFGLDDFLTGVKNGKWQDDVLAVRVIEDKKARDIRKKKCHMVTISGSFDGRNDQTCRKHSGYIAIDIDKIENPNTIKAVLANDKYMYAIFESISGKGLCALVRIDGTRHADAFEGICAYLYETYQIIVDRSGSNVSRSRFISFDPYMVQNDTAVIFKKYLPKKKPKKQNQVVFVQSDFDEIITQMYNRNVNICEDYREWVSVAYALYSEFGDAGIKYYHTLSSMSSKYNSDDTDKQYDVCGKNHKEGKSKTAHIGSIYYHAKANGIDIYSARTKEVIRATISQSKAGSTQKGVSDYLAKFQDIPAEESAPIIDQVVSKSIEYESDNIIEDIVSYLQTYHLKKNVISRNIEMNGRPIDDSDINSIFIDIKSICDKATKDLVCSVLFSNRIPTYNPIFEFYEENKESETGDCFNQLFGTITTDTSHYHTFIKKWYVGIIASAHGFQSPLALILTGGINKGKTQWFRRLLPRKLQALYTEDKLKEDKDAQILITKKLVQMDDEWGSMSKKEEKFFRALMSKQFFSIREPYMRVSVDLPRLAVFCGTCNELEIVSDADNNRRILPVNVLYIDFAKYNAIDKTALFIEAWKAYKAGYNFEMDSSDIANLSSSSEQHKIIDAEFEILFSHFTVPTNEISCKKWTNTEIISYIKRTLQVQVSPKKLGAALKKLGFQQKGERRGDNQARVWLIDTKNDLYTNAPPDVF